MQAYQVQRSRCDIPAARKSAGVEAGKVRRSPASRTSPYQVSDILQFAVHRALSTAAATSTDDMDKLIEALGGRRTRRQSLEWQPRYVPDDVPFPSFSSRRPSTSSLESIPQETEAREERLIFPRAARSNESGARDTPQSDGASVNDLRAIAEALGGRPIRPKPPEPSRSPTTYSIDEIIRRHGPAHLSATTAKLLPSTPTISPSSTSHSGSNESVVEPVTPASSDGAEMRPRQSRSRQVEPPYTLEEAVVRSRIVLNRLEQDTGQRSLDLEPSSPVDSTAHSPLARKPSARQQSSPHANSGPPDSFVAKLVNSKRLTRLLALKRPEHIGQTVSLADVGSSNGYPVLVFLGLGCVRYLAGLFDELAAASGIRLICIDRWGLGKTTSLPESRRSLAEWASVVEEVIDSLSIGRFGILAHSAGAPYALTVANRLRTRVQGRVNLLAPWISIDVEAGMCEHFDESVFCLTQVTTGYRWLKYVPTPLIRTVQATEWKLQEWVLGRPPPRADVGLSYDARSPASYDHSSGILQLGGTQQTSSLSGSGIEVPSALPGESISEPWTEITAVPPDPDELGERTHTLAPKRSRIRASMINVASKLSSAPPEVTKLENAAKASISSTDKPSRISRDGSPSLGAAQHRPASRSSIAQSHESSLATALIQASHAESMSGSSSDLLTLLRGDAKTWMKVYQDVRSPCKIWFGEKDDKIGSKTLDWLRREVADCELIILKDEGHNLITSSAVMLQVFESLHVDSLSAAPPA